MNTDGNNRLFLTRLDIDSEWAVTSNPRWDYISKGCNMVLMNAVNQYAEYQNCGVVHRMIRVKDAADYGIEMAEIKPEWVLNPEEL